MMQMESGYQVDELYGSIRGVVNGLKTQMSDAQAVAEEKHDACDADLREYMAGVTQAQTDQVKYQGISMADANTKANRA